MSSTSKSHMSSGQFAEQLPMFMSAREIQSQFAPLSYDKVDKYDNGWREETDDELWDRKLDESQLSKADYESTHHGREYYRVLQSQMSKMPSSQFNVSRRTGEGTYTYQDRKEDERVAAADEHINSYESTLYHHLSTGGDIPPVHLGHDPLEAPGSGKGKTVLGGHHRIAALAEADPDRLIAVLHTEGTVPRDAGHPGIFGGQRNPKNPYKYT